MTASPTALAAVLDRSAPAGLIDDLSNMGGAWRSGIETWRATDMQYAVLVAATAQRVNRRAPVMLMVRDLEGLKPALRTACQQLDGICCRWLRAVAPEAQAIVERALLEDSRPVGNA